MASNISSARLKASKIGLYYRTLRHLRLIQIANRITRRFVPRTARLKAVPTERKPAGNLVNFIPKINSKKSGDLFRFLNEERVIATQGDWNDRRTPKLWLYNLHYHEWLSCSNAPDKEKRTLVRRWIAENRPPVGAGWEPYPLSLRIVNWIKWLLEGNEPVENMIESLTVQVDWLMRQVEYHLLGNHLFANAKGLVIAGCFFDGELGQEWFRRGFSILEREVSEQFLADGGHFELSTTYHATLTEDLLDVINILRSYDLPVPSAWEKTARAAINWQRTMTRPDGLPPLFNDAAYGVSPDFSQIRNYAGRLGLWPANDLKSGLSDLPESGYFRFEGEDYSFLGDAGQIGPDYIPGHAHCDMMNFELFAKGRPIIVDVGTSTYEVGARRHFERSTRAHNTVQVGSLEQSEIWAAFRVGRRARITERLVSASNVTATYKGFDRGMQHRRQFAFGPNECTLRDFLSGDDENEAFVARFHLHPEVTVVLKGTELDAGPINMKFTGAKKIVLTPYKYAPEFNKLMPATCIEVTFDRQLETNISI